MYNKQNIQWFPGHMQKTRRMILENLKLVNLVIEILDARIPISSKNHDIDDLINNKTKLIVLNKIDLADPYETTKWLDYYKSKGIFVIGVDSKSGKNIRSVIPLINEVLKDKIISKQSRIIKNYKVKVMVLGIPNVGKSSFINRIAGKKNTRVEDRPGVTRGKQWVKISSNIDLLDMPGILWPKFDNQIIAEKLAFIGSIKDDILDIELLSTRFIEYIIENYKSNFVGKYKLVLDDLDCSSFDILNKIAINMGMLISGGNLNIERAAILVLDDFRMGKLGKITLDKLYMDING